MTTWWDILDIPKDADLRAIKHAYAKKLKTIRQDENPQEFMELRAAYERARAKCKTRPAQRTTSARMRWGDERISLKSFAKLGKPSSYTYKVETETLPGVNARAVLSEIIHVLEKPKEANALVRINEAFDDPRIEGIDEFALFEGYFIDYLINKTAYEKNRRIRDYHMKLRTYEAPIMTPPLSKPIFKRMGWDKHNYKRQYGKKLEWLGYQFGVHVRDDREQYWYREKQIRDKTLLRIKIEESDMHPGLMLIIGISFIIAIGMAVGMITDYRPN